MNYLILIIVGVLGIVIGVRLGRKRGSGLIAGQVKKKRENKEKILELLREKERVTNDDIEEMLGVSDATATRYFNELEESGKIRQIGTTGRGTYYILK